MRICILALTYFIVPFLGAQITFKVDSVTTTKIPLNDTTGYVILNSVFNNKPLIYQEGFDKKRIVPAYTNPFVYALHRAYADHRPLSFSPDDVWLLIAQGISIHIRQNFETQREKLLTHKGKKNIVIRDDKLVAGNATDWVKLLNSFKDSVKVYSGPELHKLTDINFTTTTLNHQAVRNIALLESVKEAFEFVGMSGCGIPQITLKGQKEDWQALYNKVDSLKIEGLEDWFEALKWPLQEFINVYDGKVNMRFWRSSYKDFNYYRASTVSGWFVKFFPYIEAFEIDTLKKKNLSFNKTPVPRIYFKNKFLQGYDYQVCQYSIDDFPAGISEIPITFLNKTYNTKFFKQGNNNLLAYGGFVGIEQNKNTMEVSPVQSWAISIAENSREGKVDDENDNIYIQEKEDTLIEHNEHRTDYAMRNAGPVSYRPVIKSLLNNNYDSTLNYLRKSISNLLEKEINTDTTIIEFMVTYNSEIASIKLKNLTVASKTKITEFLLSTAGNWTPPLQYTRMNYGGTVPNEMLKHTRKSNYRIKLFF